VASHALLEELTVSTENQNEVEVTSANDEIEIEVVDDTPEADRGRKPLDKPVEEPTDDELSSYSEGVQKRIKELTHARHDERRAKEALAREKQELERIAAAMVEENKRLRLQNTLGASKLATTAVNAADADVEKAKQRLKAAHDAFDTDAIVAAQEALADAKLRQQQARILQKRQPALQREQPVVQQQQPAEPKPQLDERTLRWQAQNQWFGDAEHEDMTLYALGLHKRLVREGLDPRTEQYFEQVDARLRETFPKFFGKSRNNAADKPDSRPASVVAPSARSTGSKRIQLTPTQLALARKYNLTPQQYAAEVLKLERANG